MFSRSRPAQWTVWIFFVRISFWVRVEANKVEFDGAWKVKVYKGAQILFGSIKKKGARKKRLLQNSENNLLSNKQDN